MGKRQGAAAGTRRWVAVVGAMCVLAPAGVALTSVPASAATHHTTAAHHRSGTVRSTPAKHGGAATEHGTRKSTASAGSHGVGVTSHIVLARGGYKYCLDDFGKGTAVGNRVVLWRCERSNPAQQWVFHPGGIIEPQVAPGKALGVNGSGRTVLESASAKTAAWSYRANGMLARAAPTATPQAAEPMLNDPRYKVGDGVQLIAYRQAHKTSNAHWWIKGARYATTKLVNLPDAGLNGGFWALDNGTFQQAIVYTGTDSSGAYTYQDAEQQDASFTTMPGDSQPNPATKTGKIGDVLTGGMYGWYTSTLTSNKPVSAAPQKTADGLSAWTGLGPAQFFGSSATVTSGKASGYFSYASAKDNCGGAEKMVQTDNAGTFSGSGNIPAYAADSADNLVGGQVCPKTGA